MQATDSLKHWYTAVRRRGSAIILVLVSLVLMAILGATYLQVTRFERMAASEESNIDVVLDSIIAKMKTVLREDLIKDDVNGFFANADGIEPYDYFWTDAGSTNNAFVSPVTGATVTVHVESLDDPWLATTTANAAGDEWPQGTNLMGHFLSGVGTAATPTEQNFTAAQVSVPIQTTESGTLHDADGDGLTDARWAHPPIFQIGSFQYVFSARMIDLSSKANLTTALSLIEDAGATRVIGVDVSRGNTPVELDLGGLVQQLAPKTAALPAAEGYAAVDLMIEARMGTGADYNPTPYGSITSFDTRAFYWDRAASRFGPDGQGHPQGPTTTFGVADTTELLYRNGLNSAVSSPAETAAGPSVASDGLFRTAGEETDRSAFGSQAEFLNFNPRSLMTATSGDAIFLPPTDLSSTSAGGTVASIMQRDLNNDSAANLAAVLEPVIGNPLATQMAVIIKDATDLDGGIGSLDDTELTGLASGGVTYYGLEAMPFITEVYVEAPYTALSNGTDSEPDGRWAVDFEYDDTTEKAAYAIELRNPFDQPISLRGLTLHVDGVQIGGDLLSLAGGAPWRRAHRRGKA